MLVKASIAAGAVIGAAVLLSSVDFRELYNEMYPVNGIRRDVLGLCHEAKPTFVRALRASRDNCYDSMPDPVELAIGWVRTSARLAAMRTPTAVELAERLLVEAAAQRRVGMPGPQQFTGYARMPAAALRPCDDPAKGLAPLAAAAGLAPAPPKDRLVRRLAGGEDAALAELELTPRGAARPVARPPELPVLSLGGAGDAGALDDAPAPALFLPMPAADLGDGAALRLAPRAAAPGCKTPA